ncbi:hypothetical protein IPH67_00920 [bacterium]|nr:MAG: hypothetical protein IPH67_00920 [bacterium]
MMCLIFLFSLFSSDFIFAMKRAIDEQSIIKYQDYELEEGCDYSNEVAASVADFVQSEPSHQSTVIIDENVLLSKTISENFDKNLAFADKQKEQDGSLLAFLSDPIIKNALELHDVGSIETGKKTTIIKQAPVRYTPESISENPESIINVEPIIENQASPQSVLTYYKNYLNRCEHEAFEILENQRKPFLKETHSCPLYLDYYTIQEANPIKSISDSGQECLQYVKQYNLFAENGEPASIGKKVRQTKGVLNYSVMVDSLTGAIFHRGLVRSKYIEDKPIDSSKKLASVTRTFKTVAEIENHKPLDCVKVVNGYGNVLYSPLLKLYIQLSNKPD